MEGLEEKIAGPEFNPDRFVRELSRSRVGGAELQQGRTLIADMANEAALRLKKTVYRNHLHFRDTADQVALLEMDMSDLSRLLADQKTLLGLLSHSGTPASISAQQAQRSAPEAADARDDERKMKLNAIYEKVENCISLLEDGDREALHEGDLLELDPEDGRGIARLRGFLFTDRLMLCTHTGRRGLQRYAFETAYPVTSTAVVNVRDFGSAKQAFKLLAFPDSRVFQCQSPQAKREWLDKFDAAKKARPDRAEAVERKEAVRDSASPQDDGPASPASPRMRPLPEWLADAAEELDALIVERHFEAAHKLSAEAREALESPEWSSSPAAAEIAAKIERRRKTLIAVLVDELRVTPEWTPRGGLAAARGPVRLLNALGMESRACDLFLAVCSRLVKVHAKGVRPEGSAESHVRRIAETFFCAVADVVAEFRSLFPEEKSSALAVWASAELRLLMNSTVGRIFAPRASLATIARCVVDLRERCSSLRSFGLDLTFQLDGCLRQSATRALREYRERIVDAAKGKLLEDDWKPVDFGTKAKIDEFVEEMRRSGLVVAKYVINDTWVDLSSSTLWFARSALALQSEGLRIVSEDMMANLDDDIRAVFAARLMLSIGNDSGYAQKNFKFILDTLLPLMLRKYEEEVGYENEKLIALAKKFGVVAQVPKPATEVTKYPEEYF